MLGELAAQVVLDAAASLAAAQFEAYPEVPKANATLPEPFIKEGPGANYSR